MTAADTRHIVRQLLKRLEAKNRVLVGFRTGLGPKESTFQDIQSTEGIEQQALQWLEEPPSLRPGEDDRCPACRWPASSGHASPEGIPCPRTPGLKRAQSPSSGAATDDSAWATALYLSAFPGASRVPEPFAAVVRDALASRRSETIEACAVWLEQEEELILTARSLRHALLGSGEAASPRACIDAGECQRKAIEARVRRETVEACAKLIDDMIDADRASLMHAFSSERRRIAEKIRELSGPCMGPTEEKKT